MEEMDHEIFTGDCVDSSLEGLGFNDLAVRNCSLWNSKPFLFLDLIWNFAFVVVSVLVLLISVRERPSTPLRVWIGGYAFQCLFHVGFICLDYQRWNGVQEDEGYSVSLYQSRIIRRLQFINTVVSSIWWAFGFYWIVVGGQALAQDSPILYWLSVIFLAFEVLFVMFCIGIACILLFGLLCYFPVVSTIAYLAETGKGASENDLATLTKFHYTQINPFGTPDNAAKKQDCELEMEPGNTIDSSS